MLFLWLVACPKKPPTPPSPIEIGVCAGLAPTEPVSLLEGRLTLRLPAGVTPHEVAEPPSVKGGLDVPGVGDPDVVLVRAKEMFLRDEGPWHPRLRQEMQSLVVYGEVTEVALADGARALVGRREQSEARASSLFAWIADRDGALVELDLLVATPDESSWSTCMALVEQIFATVRSGERWLPLGGPGTLETPGGAIRFEVPAGWTFYADSTNAHFVELVGADRADQRPHGWLGLAAAADLTPTPGNEERHLLLGEEAPFLREVTPGRIQLDGCRPLDEGYVCAQIVSLDDEDGLEPLLATFGAAQR